MSIVNMHEAKSQLSKLVARAEAGEEIVIARDGRPAVRLMPVRSGDPWLNRIAGALEGQISMSDNFDEPITELEAIIYDEPDQLL